MKIKLPKFKVTRLEMVLILFCIVATFTAFIVTMSLSPSPTPKIGNERADANNHSDSDIVTIPLHTDRPLPDVKQPQQNTRR